MKTQPSNSKLLYRERNLLYQERTVLRGMLEGRQRGQPTAAWDPRHRCICAFLPGLCGSGDGPARSTPVLSHGSSLSPLSVHVGCREASEAGALGDSGVGEIGSGGGARGELLADGQDWVDGAGGCLPLAVVAGEDGGGGAVVEGVILGADDGQSGVVGELVAVGVANGGVGGVVSELTTAQTRAVLRGGIGLTLAVREDGLQRSAGMKPSSVPAGESGAG